MIIVEKPATKF